MLSTPDLHSQKLRDGEICKSLFSEVSPVWSGHSDSEDRKLDLVNHRSGLAHLQPPRSPTSDCCLSPHSFLHEE